MAVQGYTSPGVSVIEDISPAIAPLLANPSVIAIVGAASGQQSASERILAGSSPVQLKFTGVDVGSVVVRAASDNNVLNAGNYSVVAGTDPNTAVSGDEPYTISVNYAPATAPTLSNAGTGTLTGTYVYAVSFVNPAGETGIGPASAQVTYNGTQGGNLTAIPIDTTVGTTTTARNIYRAKVTSGVTGTFTLVATLADNTATVLSNETTTDAVAAAASPAKEGIALGDTIVVTYDYTDNNYYNATFMSDYDDIVDKYGAPFDSNGNISSPLSFAARLAFQNGASEIICVAALSGSDTDLSSALNALNSVDSVRIVTVVSGSATVHSALAAHCTAMNTQGYYRQGIAGRDGSVTAITAATLRSAAKGFNQESMILASPANFIMQNPITGRNMSVGGQYAASAIAGMFAARDVQVPLTRKSIAGFIDLGDSRTPTEQALDSQAGLMAIINSGGVLQVRHQVTTAVGNSNTAEASVVRAKYEMAHRLRTTLDGSVVGTVIAQTDLQSVIGGVVTSVLEQLQLEGAIQAYGAVKVRLLATDSTTVEVRFQYLPQFPINNIVVRFSIDTNSGDFNITTGA